MQERRFGPVNSEGRTYFQIPHIWIKEVATTKQSVPKKLKRHPHTKKTGVACYEQKRTKPKWTGGSLEQAAPKTERTEQYSTDSPGVGT